MRTDMEPIYILGAGAVGMALAACLAKAGRDVTLVRTRPQDDFEDVVPITVTDGQGTAFTVSVQTTSLARLHALGGVIVITTKTYANADIATVLGSKDVSGILVVMQNGLEVELPFLPLPLTSICRCVLYMTGERNSSQQVLFRPIASSPIGLIQGTVGAWEKAVSFLTTPEFPFHVETDIAAQIWSKTILNAVFNSLCPLLETDNGIFVRDVEICELARQVIQECLVLAEARGVSLSEEALMNRLLAISRGSDGVLISTLQDLRAGRQTEMASLNLALAKIASEMNPKATLSRTEMLGRMVVAKGGQK